MPPTSHANPGDVGQRKVAVAAARLAAQAPEVGIETVDARLDAAALAALFARVDLGIDCSDNFGTRYALNDASRAARVPLLSGAAIRWQGQVAAFDPRDPASPCYACLYAEGDEGLEDCRSNGILGPVAGVIGTLLATEAIKMLTGTGEPLVGRLLRYDARTTAFQSARVARDPGCAVCGVDA
jgi:molybdopterin/thiamine biosynthesis adenylyltransferase